MPTEFSPTLLDNDPKFEYEPNKLIDVDSPKWFDWLESHHSFRFNAGNGGENSYRARKELNKSQGVYYWYGVKKVDNKLHKKYIGKTNEVTHRRLIEVAEVIRQPSSKQPKEQNIRPENTPQITPQFEDRLNNLEALVQHLQSQIQEGVASKKHNSPVGIMGELDHENKPLPNELDKLTNRVGELTNEFDKLNIQLQESKLEAKAAKNDATLLNQELERVRGENERLTIELDNRDSKLAELFNELANKDRELETLREECDRSITEPTKPEPAPIPTADPSVLNHQSPITSHSPRKPNFSRNYQIVSMLGCQFWMDGKKFNNQDLKDNVIDKNIASKKLELEAMLGIVINSKDAVIRRFVNILKAMGFELKGSTTDGYYITNPEIF